MCVYIHSFIPGRKKKSKETQVTVEVKKKKRSKLMEKTADHTVFKNF